ncbi:dihydroneopterin aldolase [Allomesorhizobium alhagi]|uniref:Dihydroneopterin aldolase n=1 Tax=Mesorhizobium alhagi CCNWXJ12-2 TaxID=1107882 RepID=H0HRB6_9HYPH|nr:dihydroneopterin aldolase [Mesorhizobium alhagi]EHK56745.1 dihydroneopterin aldolase [Mesorhizobium alhagi CCNWXJ12-2]
MKRAVVKLGGSTANEAVLAEWIAALAGSALPLVIVPGGGRFADEIRNAQKDMGFSDKAAHAMAILAMDQLGHVILDRDDRLVPAQSMQNIERALRGGKIPVWLPSFLAIPAPDIRASWDITSDALAAWLAGKLGADALLLVKQTAAFSSGDDVASLTVRGIVDAGFAAMLPADVDLYLAGPRDAATAVALLASGKLPGTAIYRSGTPARKTG